MKATTNAGIENESGLGYEPDAGGGGVDAYGRDGGSSTVNFDRISDNSAKEPSIIEQAVKLATQGVPFAGGNIKPEKIGSGYGAKWSMKFSKGGKVSEASKRADGIAQRGKTKGRYL
mgnify:CR=1 FL=1